MADNPHRDAAAPMNQNINDMMGKPVIPSVIDELIEGSIIWNDSGDPEEATSLDPADNAPARPAEPVEGVRDEGEQGFVSDDAELVAAEADAGEAMTADEVYAASFQSEDGDQTED